MENANKDQAPGMLLIYTQGRYIVLTAASFVRSPLVTFLF